MTNTLAIALGLFIFGAIAIDFYSFDAEGMLFLSCRFLGLLDWMAFWR